jgi:hypothetical protein
MTLSEKIKKTYFRFSNSDLYWNLEYHLIRIPRRWYNYFMNRTIRYAKIGFNPEDMWSLDRSIAKYLLPRLKHFKKITNCYPTGLTRKQWERELNKMIAAFDLMTDDDKYYKMDSNTTRYNNSKADKIIDDGLDSFRKYFKSLWW